MVDHSVSNGFMDHDEASQDAGVSSFRISLDSPEIIERSAQSIRVLDGQTSLNLLAHYVPGGESPVLEVYPPESVPDEELLAFCYRVAWLALYGSQAKAHEQGDAGSPPTIDVVVPAADPHITLPSNRSAVYQHFGLAAPLNTALPIFPLVPALTKTSWALVSHPLRPPTRPASRNRPWLYSRWIPHLSLFFAMRLVTEDDVDLLHRWLNIERVNQFWGDASEDIDIHRQFIRSRLDDPHTEPVLGCYVDAQGRATPAVYLDLYWAKEDRLGELYEAEDYDQGVHLFVGSEQHRGSDYLRAWLPSVVHYMFLSDPRTTRIVAEPNIINTNVLGIFEKFAGMKKKKEVTFPHKTAALVMVTRPEFFEGPFL